MREKEDRVKTLGLLLERIPDVPCYNNEFLRKHVRGIMSLFRLDDTDCELFWKCMRVFDACGVDYYDEYINLICGRYGSFENGFVEWIGAKTSYWNNNFRSREELNHVINLLRFFEMKEYQGISIEKFEEAYKRFDVLGSEAKARKWKSENERSQEILEEKLDSYFNFSEFSNFRFNIIAEEFLIASKNSISINDALQLAKNAPKSTYVVILWNSGFVCKIGKTTQPLSYIELHRKKQNAESAYFMTVDDDYADDLVVFLKVSYEVGLDSIRLSGLNRKYGTQKKAIYAYKKSVAKTRKEVIAAIAKSKMMTIELPNGQILVDKPLLHRSLCSD
ncbi:hypothetical protein H9X86_10850 [Pseudoflavonifractor capillosus]|uniref:hypothetical protein n=1 Tax=Pseudoflavonifractor capillosus TaxID=106588 RepID=UPI0019585A14|nr:hypothetical protein [Pseudoflavonifractor capillosus]MBM6897844.1 hypothetical protein [Pseudoflavonifractor capillosus]